MSPSIVVLDMSAGLRSGPPTHPLQNVRSRMRSPQGCLRRSCDASRRSCRSSPCSGCSRNVNVALGLLASFWESFGFQTRLRGSPRYVGPGATNAACSEPQISAQMKAYDPSFLRLPPSKSDKILSLREAARSHALSPEPNNLTKPSFWMASSCSSTIRLYDCARTLEGLKFHTVEASRPKC